jgi:ABC-type polysaccharide/polyol phosphate export permease
VSEATLAARAPDVAAPRKPNALRELWRFRQLVGVLVVRELKVRYKRSIFGLLWTMLNPLLLMLVYTIVFTAIMPSSVRNFSIFLLSGLLPWIFFATAVTQGLFSILGNQDLIRKVRVPQAVFPLSVVGSNLVNFSLSLVPLLLLMLALRQPFGPALLFLPAATFVLLLFTSGITLLLATFTVFFRDVRHLTEVALQLLLYLSPVLYSVEMLNHDKWWFPLFRTFLALNPMSYLIPLLRDPVFYARLPPAPEIALAACISIAVFAIGLAVFTRLSPRHIHHL